MFARCHSCSRTQKPRKSHHWGVVSAGNVAQWLLALDAMWIDVVCFGFTAPGEEEIQHGKIKHEGNDSVKSRAPVLQSILLHSS